LGDEQHAGECEDEREAQHAGKTAAFALAVEGE
jgi:hypothetical protein